MMVHENLRNLRLAANMTQEQAAEKIGITRQGLSSYETGRTLPDVEMLKRLAELYNTDLESLIYGADKKAKPYHTVKIVVVVLYILLTFLTLTSSAFLWVSNRYFAIPDGQMLTDTIKPVFEIRTHLLTARQFADNLILAVVLIGAVFLLIYCAVKPCRYRLKQRLAAVFICSGTILMLAFLFGISDHVYHVVDYLITPLRAVIRLCVFLLLDILIAQVQKRRKTGNKR